MFVGSFLSAISRRNLSSAAGQLRDHLRGRIDGFARPGFFWKTAGMTGGEERGGLASFTHRPGQHLTGDLFGEPSGDAQRGGMIGIGLSPVAGENDDSRGTGVKKDMADGPHSVQESQGERDDDDIGMMLFGQFHSLLTVQRVANDVDAVVPGQDGTNPQAHDRAIFSQQNGDRFALAALAEDVMGGQKMLLWISYHDTHQAVPGPNGLGELVLGNPFGCQYAFHGNREL